MKYRFLCLKFDLVLFCSVCRDPPRRVPLWSFSSSFSLLILAFTHYQTILCYSDLVKAPITSEVKMIKIGNKIVQQVTRDSDTCFMARFIG